MKPVKHKDAPAVSGGRSDTASDPCELEFPDDDYPQYPSPSYPPDVSDGPTH